MQLFLASGMCRRAAAAGTIDMATITLAIAHTHEIETVVYGGCGRVFRGKDVVHQRFCWVSFMAAISIVVMVTVMVVWWDVGDGGGMVAAAAVIVVVMEMVLVGLGPEQANKPK